MFQLEIRSSIDLIKVEEGDTSKLQKNQNSPFSGQLNCSPHFFVHIWDLKQRA